MNAVIVEDEMLAARNLMAVLDEIGTMQVNPGGPPGGGAGLQFRI